MGWDWETWKKTKRSQLGSSSNQLQQELQEDGEGGGGQLVHGWTKMLAQPWLVKANGTNTLSFSLLKISYSFLQI